MSFGTNVTIAFTICTTFVLTPREASWCYIISLLFHLPSQVLPLLISLHLSIPWWFFKKNPCIYLFRSILLQSLYIDWLLVYSCVTSNHLNLLLCMYLAQIFYFVTFHTIFLVGSLHCFGWTWFTTSLRS